MYIYLWILYLLKWINCIVIQARLKSLLMINRCLRIVYRTLNYTTQSSHLPKTLIYTLQQSCRRYQPDRNQYSLFWYQVYTRFLQKQIMNVNNTSLLNWLKIKQFVITCIMSKKLEKKNSTIKYRIINRLVTIFCVRSLYWNIHSAHGEQHTKSFFIYPHKYNILCW